MDPNPHVLSLGIHELDLLDGFSKIRAERRDSPDAALRWLVEALPMVCESPETAWARVVLDGRSFTTPNFRATSENHRAAIAVDGIVRGEVELGEPGGAESCGTAIPPRKEWATLKEVAREIGLYVRQVEVEAELLGRDRILRAISKIAAGLMAARSLEEALPAVLRQAGEAFGADRVAVLESTRASEGGFLANERGVWNAPGVNPPLHGMQVSKPAGKREAAVLGSFLATLAPDTLVTAFPRTMQGPLAMLLGSRHVQSVLLVPIPIEGRPWGYLSFSDCHAERKWTAAESDSLQMLGELIGASMARTQHTTELADAKRIVENGTTVLFRAKAEPGLPFTYISENVSKWGYVPAQFLASPTFHLTLVHPDDRAEVSARMTSLLASHAPSWLRFRIRLADGNYRWFENHLSAIRDAAGHLAAFEGLLFDITERKKAEDQFSFVNTLFVTAMEKSPNGFLVVGVDRRILKCNQRFLDMWKIPADAAKTTLEEILQQAASRDLKDSTEFLAGLERLYQHPEVEVQDEIEFADGRIFERHSAALRAANQEHLGWMFFFRDITERKRTEHEMARLARTDVLTGLANRATLLDRLSLSLAASRRGDKPFAVHFMDLDNFKDVNDSLGHHTGDVLLKTVAQRMTDAVRENDLVARFGGDEFSILQTDVTDPATAGTLAAKIRAMLAEPYVIDGNVLRITATIGIALYAPEIENPAEILAQADRALYRAKEEGRDRYRFHSRELDAVVHERVSIAEELRAGIERNELELYYQPQVTVATGEVVGVEALVRWNHPRLGKLLPGAFLSAAEKTGVIVPLGAWVLDQACRQFREWRDQSVEPPLIAVNLSGSQLKLGRDFFRDVQTTLAKWGLSPHDLEFDVPEAVLSDSYEAQPDVLQRLCDLGVRLAIDDFGAEYTSIGRLKAYQITRLKIAPELIQSMTFDPADAGTVRLMLHLASQLGMEIIAKSVETKEQQAFLLSSGEGANAQGFFYSEPLPAAQATAFLRRKQHKPAAAGEASLPALVTPSKQ